MFSTLRLIITYFYDYTKIYYIPAAATLLFLMLITGRTFTTSELILATIVVAFTILHVIMKWLENQDGG
jgi:hypothetical protein